MAELFASLPEQLTPPAAGSGAPRLGVPQRDQLILCPGSLDALLPADHMVRLVEAFVGTLDLRPLYDAIGSREGTAGHPAADPKLLVALWLYATIDGVGSARELARLCETSLPYQWLRGGVRLNHHTLSDARLACAAWLDAALVASIAALRAAGAITLATVAQDGMRVRASAGAGSFRRRPRLERCLEEARVSFTDPEAVVMKMPDGGFRPAYNTQLAVETEHGLIVGLDVTSTGADQPSLEPMVEQIKARTGRRPQTVLVDGGFFNRDSVTRLSRSGVELLMPLPKPRRADRAADQPVHDDTPQVAALRRRMEEAGSQQRYRQRARWIEWTNAGWRNRDWRQVLVRGRDKVRAVAGWQAMAHNLQCILRAEALATVFGLPVFRPA